LPLYGKSQPLQMPLKKVHSNQILFQNIETLSQRPGAFGITVFDDRNIKLTSAKLLGVTEI
jgi:hypothetical protein